MTDTIQTMVTAYGFKGVDVQLHLSHRLFSTFDVNSRTKNNGLFPFGYRSSGYNGNRFHW